ncbi:interferon-induced GTP-binding protein Mx [Glonium stellatum]|uniref:Interferon-induced GTP-binding protein Mx n=1 Tax=Glonium stellatum TaxID=574774 RepID=A0A8E2F5A9_9PEZI|nr:interferon-induced GTP-binding protein Mx [Glonium stellatum]
MIHSGNGNGEILEDAPHGQTTSGIEIVGRGIKELVLVINKMEGLGLAKSDIPLPRIIVVGDQSAGKSSLIEAISEIKVPRSSGTCTRCPLSIMTTANDEPGASWECRVYLHRRYDLLTSNLPSLSGKPGPFYPWTEKDTPVDIPFTIIEDKDALQDIIHRAQLATLNPGHPHMRYVSGPVPAIGDDCHLQQEFSPNVVCLDISGPDLPNLSFYDLPGVINQTEDGTKPYLVKLVKNLVKDYINSENALVLLACSMESDVANSSATRIVRNLKAESRCIGVLTKPDRLPQGDPVDIWHAILNGQKFPLGHSYFVTKQPSQSEIDMGITHVRARELEGQFFETQEPWATKFAQFKSRYGTTQLQTILSQKLTTQILTNLPIIKDRLRIQFDQLDAELRDLPEPPTDNAVQIVLNLLQEFTSCVQKAMEGEHKYNKWRLAWKEHRQNFYQELCAQKPTLSLRGDLDQGLYRGADDANGVDGAPITIDSDMESEIRNPAPASVENTPKKRKMEAPATPKQKRPQLSNTGPVRRSNLTKIFKLDELRKVLDDISVSDLPGEMDSRALDHLILDCLQNWDKPMINFFQVIDYALKGQLRLLFDGVFKAWDTTELYQKAWEAVEKYTSVLLNEQRNVVATQFLRSEQEKPFTGDTVLWESNKTATLKVFQKARSEARVNVYFRELEEAIGKQLSLMERNRRMNTDLNLREIINTDPYHREVEVMAKIRGYYNIASLRFFDVVCLSMQLKLFKLLRTQLLGELMTGLGMCDGNSRDNCIRLLAEDSQRERRRIALKNKRQALIEGQACLDALGRKYQNAALSQSGVFAGSFLPIRGSTPVNRFSSTPSRIHSPGNGSLVMDDMDVS